MFSLVKGKKLWNELLGKTRRNWRKCRFSVTWSTADLTRCRHPDARPILSGEKTMPESRVRFQDTLSQNWTMNLLWRSRCLELGQIFGEFTIRKENMFSHNLQRRKRINIQGTEETKSWLHISCNVKQCDHCCKFGGFYFRLAIPSQVSVMCVPRIKNFCRALV
jgi:hypothetical protein